MTRTHTDERGFTLIELLVVILIIGILAAIALPAFLGQRTKGQDSDAKSNARNVVVHVESCFTSTQDYADCKTTADLSANDVPIEDCGGSAAAITKGSVCVVSGDKNGFEITARSDSDNTFSITKTSSGTTRTCVVGSGANAGGCGGGATSTPGSSGSW